MTPDILAALKHNYDKLAQLPTSGPASHRIAISAEFYSLLAQATNNEVLKIIIESLSAIVLQQVEKSRTNTMPDLVVHRRRLLQFLSKRDANGAKREITEHLQRLHKHLNREARLNAKRRAPANSFA
jgi:DNA-binding GntR family transcriptional regulator